ncbi:hypothetical protein [Pantoea eucrina]|uniref:hypothetical protein n=1 Tax=Pantoea eucrina TaxID=472693 RepID=UPI00301E527D
MDSDLIALETMLAAKDTADFTFWIVIGTWVAGIATALAVIISLYVTVNQKRVRLRFNMSEKVLLSPLTAFGDSSPRGVYFQITNLSDFPVQINNLGLSCASLPWLQKKYWHLIIKRNQLGDSLPKRIEQGEQCHLWIPLDDGQDDWFEYLSNIISEANCKPREMRLVVTTSFGKSPSFKFPKQILERLDAVKKA